MESPEMLDEGCEGPPGETDCVYVYIDPREGRTDERFVESHGGEMIGVRYPRNQLFGPKANLPTIGLSRPLRASERLLHDPQRTTVISTEDYRIEGLPSKIRLIEFLYRPPADPDVEGGPLLFAIGQEVDLPAADPDPVPARVERIDDKYYEVTKDNGRVFRVLTFTDLAR
jgi:hypothetical protein